VGQSEEPLFSAVASYGSFFGIFFEYGQRSMKKKPLQSKQHERGLCEGER